MEQKRDGKSEPCIWRIELFGDPSSILIQRSDAMYLYTADHKRGDQNARALLRIGVAWTNQADQEIRRLASRRN